MSYLVLARKYRPQTFEDLVGQDHVARTLANAIATGRIAHAFLFTGVRGVGKTTSARLLAKCLNCAGADGRAAGPTATPCNVCAPCREITAGQDLDVQEIDGASYNGVDEVRRLQEGVTFRPARDRFKIYVVDEVHMLSTAAWNAFLKTLEEPPPHVKFIFATTEVHKVPVTILSRCQRYDFKLIPTQTIAARLDDVLEREKIRAEPAAVQILAREAAGSMRDAMSVLDQVIAFSGENLTADDVARVLGVADRKILHDLATALVVGDAAGCVGVVRRVAEQGYDLAHVAKDILRHLRDLVVAKVASGSAPSAEAPLRDLLDLSDEESRDILALAERAETDDLSRLFQGFSRAYDDVVRGGQPRMTLEMALVRLARRPPLLPLDDLLGRIADLERRLGGGAPASPASRGAGSGGSGSRGTPSGVHLAPPLVAGEAESARPHGPTAVRRVDVRDDAPAGRAAASKPDFALPSFGSLALVEAPPPRSEPAPVRSIESARPIVAPAAVALEPPRPESKSNRFDDWRAIVARVRQLRPAVASLFEQAVPVSVTPAQIVVTFATGAAFFSVRATETEAFAVLREAATAHFGGPCDVVVDANASANQKPGAETRSLASVDAGQRKAARERARAAVENHPVVREVIRVFDAQLRDVKLPRDDV